MKQRFNVVVSMEVDFDKLPAHVVLSNDGLQVAVQEAVSNALDNAEGDGYKHYLEGEEISMTRGSVTATSDEVPAKKEGSNLFRTVFQVVVLSNDSVSDMTIGHVADAITVGDCSGHTTVVEERAIGVLDMIKQLEDQSSDPSFLISEDILWKYKLHGGDEITIGKGKKKIVGVIGSIEYVNDEIIRITWKDGGVTEACIDELC